MYYAKIKKNDISNGPGVRTSLYVSGCRHHCKGCFNSEAWDFLFGKKFTKDTIDEIIEASRPSYIEGLTIVGGEPLEPENQEEVLNTIKAFRKNFPNKTIWLFSGFLFDKQILKQIQQIQAQQTQQAQMLQGSEFAKNMASAQKDGVTANAIQS